MTAIGIIGSEGRMGRAIAAALVDHDATLAGGIDLDGGTQQKIVGFDVLIDFSAPAALAHNLDIARTAQTPLVIGTTGLTADHHALIDAAAHDIAILQTGNTSLGVTLLAALVEQAAARLADWDIEVVEMHHRAKRDAPSGTALLLGEAAARGRGTSLSAETDRDRVRSDGAIGFASLRGGTVVGDHTVVLAGPHERLTLGHVAEDRSLFAHGAIRAALWLARQPPGRYTMRDMLGL
ncbi:MAG: 4-hydroxy-tetrahydrodipicolinate reductase [Pseudomonadota bacterium]